MRYWHRIVNGVWKWSGMRAWHRAVSRQLRAPHGGDIPIWRGDHTDSVPVMLPPGYVEDRPRRLWRYPPRDLTRPWALQAFRATDEYHNPTIALGVPWVGMWVLAYPRRLNTVLCGDGDCQEPTCEIAAFYRQQV